MSECEADHSPPHSAEIENYWSSSVRKNHQLSRTSGFSSKHECIDFSTHWFSSQTNTKALAGLLLVPNGEALGRALGDHYPSHTHSINSTLEPEAKYPHPWSVFFTVLGTVLLDFDADACQSPSRSYLLDVTVPGNIDTALLLSELLHLFPHCHCTLLVTLRASFVSRTECHLPNVVLTF
jgi:hypothetical protein